MPRLRIGLIGWGTVGSALGRLVLEGALPLDLVAVCVRDPAAERAHPLPNADLASPSELVAAADVVVELAGGIEGPLDWARQALAAGRPFVTANKALLASHGAELADLAGNHEAALLASASVGGGVPMIELVEHLAAGHAIARLTGLLNATTTFILGRMGAGETYEEALAEAQLAGYAEADPSLDVDGHDAAQKLAILASVAWGSWRAETDVETIGIIGLQLQPGSTVRLVAEATADRLSVRPVDLSRESPLASAGGVDSMLEVRVTEGETFRISGPGAGGPATAGAVYADLARLVRGERPILFGGAA